MRRLAALVALWAVFAAMGVAVGFGAVRLLQYPVAHDTGESGTQGSPARGGPVLTTPSTGTALAPTTATGHASTTSTGAATTAGAGTSTLGIHTVAGYVSASCTSGVVRMSASPNRGWEVGELSMPGRIGEVEFEQTEEREGEVSVHARCEEGRPDFFVDDSEQHATADE
jgi:hypothetical protein